MCSCLILISSIQYLIRAINFCHQYPTRLRQQNALWKWNLKAKSWLTFEPSNLHSATPTTFLIFFPGKIVRHFPVMRETQNLTSWWLSFFGGLIDFQSASAKLSRELNDLSLTFLFLSTARSRTRSGFPAKISIIFLRFTTFDIGNRVNSPIIGVHKIRLQGTGDERVVECRHVGISFTSSRL